MYKRCIKQLAFLFAVLFSTQALSAPQWCAGKVGNLYVYNNGDAVVQPSWRGDYIRLCNTTNNLGSISPQTCLTWISLLKSAVQRQSDTIIYFNEAPACNLIPTYGGAPEVGYVMMNN